MDLFALFGRIAIDAGDSQQTIEDVTKSAEGLAESLDETGDSADGASEKLGESGKFNAASVWMGNVLTRTTEKVYNLGKAFILSGFNFNASMETYQALFSSLLGNDPEKATKFIEDLKKFAKETPLALQGVAANAMQMLNFGFDESEIISELTWLGDIAQGDQARLDSIVYAYSQVRDFGALRAQEFNQFVNNGVPVREMLANYLGVENAEVAKMQENGMITFKILRNAMKVYTEEGGIFFNGMNNYMDTFKGQKEKLLDAYNEMSGAFTEPFYEVTKSEILPTLMEELAEFTMWIEANGPTITNLAESIGTLATDGIKTLSDALKALVSIDAKSLVAYQTIAGTIAFMTGHPALGLSLFGAAGYTIKADSEGGAAYKYHADENGDLDIDAVSGATTVAEEKANEIAKGVMDALIIDELSPEEQERIWKYNELLMTIQEAQKQGHQSGSSNPLYIRDPDSLYKMYYPDKNDAMMDFFATGNPEFLNHPIGVNNPNTEDMATSIKGAIAEILPGAVASGFSNVTITVNVDQGNVNLDTGALVGRIAPHVNVVLGAMGVAAVRGVADR